jgi:hypothetical protein
MQNQHLAPSTQQAEQSWLNTRAGSEACQSIFLKLTKDEKQLDKNLELVGWYHTVPYLRLESQVKRHIATTSYLSTFEHHSGALNMKTGYSQMHDISMMKDRSWFKQHCSHMIMTDF